jgi:hypothetical protein
LEFARLARLTCAAFNIRLATYTWSVLATGSGNAGTCEKLHDRSRIRFRQKAGVCANGLTLWRSQFVTVARSIMNVKKARGADGGDVSRCTSIPAQAVTVLSLWCDGQIPTGYQHVTHFYVTWSRVLSRLSLHCVSVRGNVTSVHTFILHSMYEHPHHMTGWT